MRRFLAVVGLALPLLAAVASQGGRHADAGQTTATVSADAGIVFYRGGWGASAIWMVRSNGSGLKQLTHPSRGSGDNNPVWSPDRRRIAFLRWVPAGEDWRGDTTYRPDLMVMEADGSELHRLTTTNGWSFDWSRDGRLIAFVRWYKGSDWLWTIRPDGAGARRLVEGSGIRDPAWSPNGREIAYRQWISKQNRNWYFVVGAGGGRPRLLLPTFTSGMADWPVAWSPSGREIALLSSPASCLGCASPDCGCPDRRTSLYVARRDGSGLRKLVAGASSADVSRPKWSPDGSKILVECGGDDVEGPDSAFLVYPENGKSRRVASNTDGADWSPDGRSIAFVRHIGEDRPGDLYLVKASGGSGRLILRGGVSYGDFDW